MRFYEGSMFPSEYKNQVIVAKHGSWNRSKKSGYVLTSLNVNGANATNEQEFASGWLDEEAQEAWGRPVDVQEMKDGSLLVSDDMAGVIYRVTYSAK
ncbi:sorbosone dehydrogenase family protein [Algoriphagus sp. AGSA1]|uniref:PQQ-dependent sugar dehydrogenase n=1 Tax=Algoriphagus sp. AGSA1 TaxID=2907213 RepID=UPI0027957478|nr:hypothetical protein [Algoriphagus sp. AGSA1]